MSEVQQKEGPKESFVELLEAVMAQFSVLRPEDIQKLEYANLSSLKQNLEALKGIAELIPKRDLQAEGKSFVAEIQKGGRIAIPLPFRAYHNLTYGDLVLVTVSKAGRKTETVK